MANSDDDPHFYMINLYHFSRSSVELKTIPLTFRYHTNVRLLENRYK